MARMANPFGSQKSWTPTPENRSVIQSPIDGHNNQGNTSSMKKFKLLFWKNYKIQTRHKVQTIVEVLLPLLFTAVLVIVRYVIVPDRVLEPTIYQHLELKNNVPYVIREKCNEIFYTPKNAIIDKLMDQVRSDYFTSEEDSLNYTFVGFSTEQKLLDAYHSYAGEHKSNIHTSVDYEATVPVLSGVVFTNEFQNGKFPRDIKYTLRFPATQRSEFDLISERFGIQPAWFTELVYPLFQLLGPRSRSQPSGGLPGYFEEGFLYLQYAIDTVLTRTLLNSTEEYDKLDIKLRRFPYPPFIDDKYLVALQGWLPLIIMMSFIYPVINITKAVVHEKERRLKESMKIMGLPNWLHWMAWFTKSFLFLLGSIIIMTILLKSRFSADQDLAVLSESDGFVIFFIFLFFICYLIFFAFFVSTIFSSANSGATAAGVLWFLFFVPYFFLQPRYNFLSREIKMICCFLVNTPIAFACQILCQFEGTGAGLQWNTIFLGSSPDDNFSIFDCMIMMGINGIIYMLLGIYIEAVRPGAYGVPLPWNFFLKKWYWTGSLRVPKSNTLIPLVTKGASDGKSNLFETEPQNLHAGVQIVGLTKNFGRKVAVNNLHLNLYENQITALLGHNGAGKTTTMSILTGLFTPTSGSALINGYDISKDIRAVRSSLGLCPQHDVLFDELTVEEHLKFFCLMKGYPEFLVDAEIDRMLNSLGLGVKRNAQAQTLSGGMKRKLSVGIALCGGSKIVLLDEPSSGMDVGARRSTWDLIQMEKKNRTILLSTHYMEEADLLGDRIAIMADGELQCCGSSLFLKKKYGGGYHLIIVKDPSCNVNNITELIRSKIPDAEIDQNVGAELSYSLPDEKSVIFKELFEEIEHNKESLGIASYGASITTMEEVFMKVGREAELRKIEQETGGTTSLNHSGPSVESVMTESSTTSCNPSGSNNHTNNVTKDHTSTRITFENLSDSKNNLCPSDGEDTGNNVSKREKRNRGLTLMVQQLRAMVVKKCIYAVRNRFLLSVQLGIPVFYLTWVLIVLSTLPGLTDPPALTLSLSKYEKISQTVTSVKCPAESRICGSYRRFVGKNYIVEEIQDEDSNFVDYILAEEKKDLVRVNFKYIVGFEETINETNHEITGFFNNQPFHAPPLTLNYLTNSILKNSTNYSLEITNHPLPYSNLDSLKQTGTIYSVGFQVGYNIAFGMSFLAASFVVFLIRERESKSKHLQFVSGVEFPIFWTASFLVDMSNFMIPCLALNGVLILFKIEDFYNVDMQIYLLIILTFYGFAVIPFMYLWSFAFTIPTSGLTRMALFNIFTGIATMLSVVILQIPELGLVKVAQLLNSIFLIFPNYALGMGIVQLSSNYQFHRKCAEFNLEFLCAAFEVKSNYLDWDPIGIGRNLFYLACVGTISFFLLFVNESKICARIFGCFCNRKNEIADESDDIDDDTAEDTDIQTENDRIRKTNLPSLFQTDNLVLRDLTKYYNNSLTAVDHLNLGVKRGETFGLLGVNGAGKTTTFKMLTGDIPVSKGDAFIYSHSVRNEIKKVHNNLGYTPQFDAVIEEMTGRETIYMYARLRGIAEKKIPKLVEKLGKVLLFSSHMEKEVGDYSGGNKRKLSTALALIGNPPLIFLDEPSAGIDPIARRHLWNAISLVRESGTSIVLTSHSMEECEALCTRLAIMVNGKFRCLGSPQHLKNKFGDGYTLIAQIAPKGLEEPITRAKQELGRRRSSSMGLRKLKSAQKWETDLDLLRNYIEDTFKGCILKDIHPGFVHYHIPQSEVTWGQMFAQMEIAKERFNLEAYSVGQTSLEQVFLNFTKAQINIDSTENSKKKKRFWQ